MANTGKLGYIWKALAWGDGEPVPRVTLPDGSLAEAYAALGYSWDAQLSVWTKDSFKTILQASISVAGSGDNTVVASVSAKQIKVVSYTFGVVTAVNTTWKSGAATTLSGAIPFAANGGIAISSRSNEPLLVTTSGQALVLNLSGAVQVSGHLSYYAE